MAHLTDYASTAYGHFSADPYWQLKGPVNLPWQDWSAPERDTHFFCDLHADASAFLRSLKLSRVITEDSTLEQLCLTTEGKQSEIIIGGDCFDKGPSNLALFCLLTNLRAAGAQIVLLAGNHDVRVLAGLHTLTATSAPAQSHFFIRMGRKTVAFLAEIAHNDHDKLPQTSLTEPEILTQMQPHQDWASHFWHQSARYLSLSQKQKEHDALLFKQADFFNACAEFGLDVTTVYRAALRAYDLFLTPEGPFFWFSQELKLIHQNGSYLFCHAGVDDRIAEKVALKGTQPINERFRTHWQQGELLEIYYSELGNIFRTKYREKDWPLTRQGSELLKQAGIYALVNGHRSSEQGQRLYVREGLLNFDCDTKLNANCRKKNNILTEGEAVTIFEHNGMVKALCSDLSSPRVFHPSLLLDTTIRSDAHQWDNHG